MNYNKYANDVIGNKIITCKWVKQACKRYLSDLENGESRGLWFDKQAADRVINFFSLVPHIKGEWAGQPLMLEPWQEFIIANMFGWKKGGNRRFRTVYLEVARKNGKSSMLAAIGLYLLKFDGEPGSEVYSAATTRDQARLVFDIARQMVDKSDLKKYLTTMEKSIFCTDTASKFAPVSSEAKTLDGLNIHGAIVDELHAHKTRDVYDVLNTGTGSRRQPLITVITTAGHDKNTICWEQHQYTEKVLDGLITDDSHFGIIYTLDEGDKWEDESVWEKANPNLGVSVKPDDLKSLAIKAKEIVTQTNAFLTKRMNVWTDSLTRWISADKWDACGQNICSKYKTDISKLGGLTCYGGLDLSSTTDTSAFVLVFPPQQWLTKYMVLCRIWIPKDNMRERVRKDRVPYDVWVNQGWITATPGNIIDYSFIINQINKDAQAYNLRQVAFDRWGSTQMVQTLQDMGFEEKSNKHAQRHLIDFGQGYASMSPPTKELEKLVLSGEIQHRNNPALAWMISNTVIKIDAAENMKPDKSQSTDRIDGVVALIMAIDRAVGEKVSKSVYEDRGVLLV